MLGRFGFPHYQLKGRLYSQQAQIRRQRRLLFEQLFQFHYQQHNSMFHDLPFSVCVSGFIWKKNHISYVINMLLRVIMQMCELSYFHYLPWGRCHDKRFHQLEGFGCFLFAKTLLAEVSRLHGTSVPPSNFPTRKFLWRWKDILWLFICRIIYYWITIYHDYWNIQHLPVWR